MTLWLTDCPAKSRAFLGQAESFAGCDAGLLEPSIRELPPVLFPDVRAMQACRSAASFASRRDWVIAIVDHAGQSQFEAINAALRNGIGLPPYVACLALTGKKFRGQRQRSWTALPGNMHLTARFETDLDAARDQSALNMIPSMATARTIQQISTGRLEPRIKWVNDVWIDGGKVSGALTSTSIKAGRITGVTFGIGLNIDAAPSIETTPFVPRATCLADHDQSLRGSLPRFFSGLVDELASALGELAKGHRDRIFQRYLERAGFLGKTVRIWPDDTEDNWRQVAPLFRGRVDGLNEDLSLRVSGHDNAIRSGRMAYEEHCALLESARA